MIKRVYEPTKPYRIVAYARMSDPKQNRRSPDQQLSEVQHRLKVLQYPWVLVKSYRDDGVSGRKIKKRLEFQRMLREIMLGIVVVDLIVVDTIERLGRAEEITEIRRKLAALGVLVVSADKDFADPTGFMGKSVNMLENFIATEDNAKKAHFVTRGKKDAVRRKRWPGGPAPFGFRLERITDLTTPRGFYSILVPIPAEVEILNALFRQADSTGHGPNRLARWWNESHVPPGGKPISPSQIRYLLKNVIYIGILDWGMYNTDLVNDTHVRELNPDGPTVVADFCEPIVDPELFRRVEVQTKLRSDVHTALQKGVLDDTPKLLRPLGRGLSLKYLLAGLVRCGHCGSAMRTVPSRHHHKSNRAEKVFEYVHHSCPRGTSGGCENRHYFREDHVREAVVGRVRAKVFPLPETGEEMPEWLSMLFAQVEAEIAQQNASRPDSSAARRVEIELLTKRMNAWMMELGDAELNTDLRTGIKRCYSEASARRTKLLSEDANESALANAKATALNPKVVFEALRRLSDVLAENNPTAGNVELSRHIDRIDCFNDGRVVLRGTTLGVLGDAAVFLTRSEPNEAAGDANLRFAKIASRDRIRRYLPDLSGENTELDQSELLATDRFAGYSEKYFWEDSFYLPKTIPWYEAAAEEVARERLAGKTHEQLAAHFGKTVPTIRMALKFAAQCNPELLAQPRKMPRARWQDTHYEEVSRMKANGASVAAIAKALEVSEPLIRAALKIAEANNAESKVDRPLTDPMDEKAG